MQDVSSIPSALKIANLFKACRKYTSAKLIYHKIIDKFPTDFRAHFNIAQILLEEQNLDDALTHFHLVIELNFSVMEAYSSIAAIYIRLSKSQLAVDICMQGLSVVGDDRLCLYNLNTALRQVGQIDTAIALSWAAIKVDKAPYLTPATNPIPPSTVSPTSITCNTLTVVCVKWGTKYDAAYVNNLYHTVKRHCPPDKRIRMVCFTENIENVSPAVECCPFDPDLPSSALLQLSSPEKRLRSAVWTDGSSIWT